MIDSRKRYENDSDWVEFFQSRPDREGAVSSDFTALVAWRLSKQVWSNWRRGKIARPSRARTQGEEPIGHPFIMSRQWMSTKVMKSAVAVGAMLVRG